MLEKYIPQLVKELELGNISLAAGVPGSFAIPLDEGLNVTITEISEGFILKSAIAPYPKTHEEFFSTQALLANLFGQGTRGAVLGLNNDATTVTLTLIIDYPVDYKGFRDILEDFINAIDFWRDEALSNK